MPHPVTIRRGSQDDLGALREICLLTGDNGEDATGRWSDDGLLADVFLEPYLRFSGGLAWVVDGGERPLGYVVGVPDTGEFVAWWRREWVSEFVARHGGLAERADEAWLFDAGTQPELQLSRVDLDAFPAHLHVDLLPEAQGRGLGRRLLGTLGHELVRRGVPGVHLGVGEANVGAQAFYRRLGFDMPEPGIMTCPSERLARA